MLPSSNLPRLCLVCHVTARRGILVAAVRFRSTFKRSLRSLAAISFRSRPSQAREAGDGAHIRYTVEMHIAEPPYSENRVRTLKHITSFSAVSLQCVENAYILPPTRLLRTVSLLLNGTVCCHHR